MLLTAKTAELLTPLAVVASRDSARDHATCLFYILLSVLLSLLRRENKPTRKRIKLSRGEGNENKKTIVLS